MRINRAIQWAIVLALAPSAGWISSDYARLHDEHDIFEAGGMPSAWWRERVAMDELVARMGKDEAFRAFHSRWVKADELQAFRSPRRMWSAYPFVQGYALRRNGKMIGRLLVREDGRTVVLAETLN